MTKPREPTYTQERIVYVKSDNAEQGYQKMYERIRRDRDSERAARLRHIQQYRGDAVRVTDDICPIHGTHCMVVLTCNGKELSAPMCPIQAGIGRIRVGLVYGIDVPADIIQTLLKATEAL